MLGRIGADDLLRENTVERVHFGERVAKAVIVALRARAVPLTADRVIVDAHLLLGGDDDGAQMRRLYALCREDCRLLLRGARGEVENLARVPVCEGFERGEQHRHGLARARRRLREQGGFFADGVIHLRRELVLTRAKRGKGERHLTHILPQGALVDKLGFEQIEIAPREEQIEFRERCVGVRLGKARDLARVEVKIGQADVDLRKLRRFAEQKRIALRLRPVQRIAGSKPLGRKIGRLDLLHARVSIETVDPAVDGEFDVLGTDRTGDRNLVFRAVCLDCLQRLMPANAVEQARGRGRRGKTSGQHHGLDQRSHGYSSLLQRRLLMARMRKKLTRKKQVQMFASLLYHSFARKSAAFSIRLQKAALLL